MFISLASSKINCVTISKMWITLKYGLSNFRLIVLFCIFNMSRKEALTQFIQQIHGRPVVVKLNSGVDYRGTYTSENIV